MTLPWSLLLALLGVAAGLRVHRILEGETLIPDLWDEWRIARADIRALDAAWVAAPRKSDCIVSLTTIPSRLPFLQDTLKSLLRQQVPPARIHLNMPRVSKREGTAYEVPDWLSRLQSVHIVACEDHGPATKFLPTLLTEPAGRKIVVVDDDRIYPANLIADLDAAATARPDAAFGLSGWLAPEDLIDRPTTLYSNLFERPPAPIRGLRQRTARPIDILQGMSGYLVRPRFFDLGRLADYRDAPPAAFFVDDVWLSGHCRVPKYVLPVRRTNYQPHRRMAFYTRTSLGLLNRGGGNVEQRNNTIMLRHFGRETWLIGRGE